MKIYYTIDEPIDGNCKEKCPFGEKHHFTRDDGTSFTIDKKVGCTGCLECRYCYGSSKNVQFNQNKILIPNLGIHEQTFSLIPENYVKCAHCYSEKYQKKPFLKLKIWWWHLLGFKIQSLFDSCHDKYFHFKYRMGIKKVSNK